MRKPILCGAIAIMLVVIWWLLTVHFNYGGNWTALYCSGNARPVPPALSSEHVYEFAGSHGYDGQFYHDLAHDPFDARGLWTDIDAPAMRCRRILVPMLAWLLAAGQDPWIDTAYRIVLLAFVFLGAFWLSQWSARWRRSGWWGLTFPLVPAVTVSIDRMTVDFALAALTVAYVLHWNDGKTVNLWFVLAAACLCRETGFLLLGGVLAVALWRGNWKRVVAFAAAAMPALAWFLFVQMRQPKASSASIFGAIPFAGLAARLLHPPVYQLHRVVALAVAAAGYAALIGILLAIFFAIRVLWEEEFDAPAATAVLFVILACFLVNSEVWAEAYAFGRTLTPLLLLLALRAFKRFPLFALPILLVIPRVGLQLGEQVIGIVGGIRHAM